MRDLSMHILDIVMNSIRASSTLIEINIIECDEILKVKIQDNGYGMDKDTVEKVLNPFYTSRKTRRVGLGLPLLHENTKKTNGHFSLTSCVKQGTTVEAVFNRNHIDCIPLGNINETILSLIILEPDIDFIYTHRVNDDEYKLNTKEIKEILDGVSINEKNVIKWLKEDLQNKFSLQ